VLNRNRRFSQAHLRAEQIPESFKNKEM